MVDIGPIGKKGNPEAKIQEAIKDALVSDGWHVEKFHGGRFQSGIPDLMAFHKEHGYRWIEIKTTKGKLTPAQGAKFPIWHKAGIGIWVLMSVDEIPLLFQEPNWVRMAKKIRKHKNSFIKRHGKSAKALSAEAMKEWKGRVSYEDIEKLGKIGIPRKEDKKK